MSYPIPRALGPLALAFPLLLSAGACDQEPSIGARVEQWADVINAQIETHCDCWQEYGYESRGDCSGDGELLPSQRRCLESALERDEEAARAYIDCVLPLEEEYLSCIDSRLVCDEGESANACYADWEVGIETCIELPPAIDRAIDDCF